MIGVLYLALAALPVVGVMVGARDMLAPRDAEALIDSDTRAALVDGEAEDQLDDDAAAVQL